MRLLNKIIEKVTTTAKKAILFGALVGGVSMLANATETTVGPTIEKAQLEAVEINLEVVVAAITKVDPGWIKSLPVLNVAKVEDPLYWYIVVNSQTVGSPLFEKTRTEAIQEGFCDPGDAEICLFGSEDDDLSNATVDTSDPERLIMKSN